MGDTVMPFPYQMKWNPDTGEMYGVAAKASERGPGEQQGDLLLWGEEQERLGAWTRR